jgi:hypothetical protein
VPLPGQGQLKALPHGWVILDQQHSRHAAQYHSTLRHSPAGQPHPQSTGRVPASSAPCHGCVTVAATVAAVEKP